MTRKVPFRNYEKTFVLKALKKSNAWRWKTIEEMKIFFQKPSRWNFFCYENIRVKVKEKVNIKVKELVLECYIPQNDKIFRWYFSFLCTYMHLHSSLKNSLTTYLVGLKNVSCFWINLKIGKWNYQILIKCLKWNFKIIVKWFLSTNFYS